MLVMIITWLPVSVVVPPLAVRQLAQTIREKVSIVPLGWVVALHTKGSSATIAHTALTKSNWLIIPHAAVGTIPAIPEQVWRVLETLLQIFLAASFNFFGVKPLQCLLTLLSPPVPLFLVETFSTILRQLGDELRILHSLIEILDLLAIVQFATVGIAEVTVTVNT